MSDMERERYTAADARVAAELTAAMADDGTMEEMPELLAARIVRDGERAVRGTRGRRSRLGARSGWLAAAAVAALWVGSAVVRRPADVTSPGALRASLLAGDSTVQLTWGSGGDSTARLAAGDIVWSDAAQAGVMRLTGLAPNERRQWQYQLWIFDRDRDQRYPVDGGTFDVPPGAGEVLVPVAARIPVGRAVMFAVTVERAGGVVVSTRERVALLAQRPG